jgi:hypothetical protein
MECPKGSYEIIIWSNGVLEYWSIGIKLMEAENYGEFFDR